MKKTFEKSFRPIFSNLRKGFRSSLVLGIFFSCAIQAMEAPEPNILEASCCDWQTGLPYNLRIEGNRPIKLSEAKKSKKMVEDLHENIFPRIHACFRAIDTDIYEIGEENREHNFLVTHLTVLYEGLTQPLTGFLNFLETPNKLQLSSEEATVFLSGTGCGLDTKKSMSDQCHKAIKQAEPYEERRLWDHIPKLNTLYWADQQHSVNYFDDSSKDCAHSEELFLKTFFNYLDINSIVEEIKKQTYINATKKLCFLLDLGTLRDPCANSGSPLKVSCRTMIYHIANLGETFDHPNEKWQKKKEEYKDNFKKLLEAAFGGQSIPLENIIFYFRISSIQKYSENSRLYPESTGKISPTEIILRPKDKVTIRCIRIGTPKEHNQRRDDYWDHLKRTLPGKDETGHKQQWHGLTAKKRNAECNFLELAKKNGKYAGKKIEAAKKNGEYAGKEKEFTLDIFRKHRGDEAETILEEIKVIDQWKTENRNCLQNYIGRLIGLPELYVGEFSCERRMTVLKPYPFKNNPDSLDWNGKEKSPEERKVSIKIWKNFGTKFNIKIDNSDEDPVWGKDDLLKLLVDKLYNDAEWGYFANDKDINSSLPILWGNDGMELVPNS